MEWKNGYSCKAFYHGLTSKAHEHLEAIAGGSFLSLTLRKAEILLGKNAENQG